MEDKGKTTEERVIRALKEMSPEKRNKVVEANPELRELLDGALTDIGAMGARRELRAEDILSRDIPEKDLETQESIKSDNRYSVPEGRPLFQKRMAEQQDRAERAKRPFMQNLMEMLRSQK